MPDDQESRTEAATPKKRSDAREKGKVAKSPEVPSALVLLTGFVILYYFSTHMIGNLSEVWQHVFRNIATIRIGESQITEFFNVLMYRLVIILAPIMFAVFVVALVANFAQVGLLFSSKAIAPSFEKIDPLKGLARIFSKDSVLQLFRSIFKIVIIGYVGYVTVNAEIARIPTLAALTLPEIGSYIGMVAFRIGIRVCALLIILSILDYGVRRYQFEQSLKMTKQEVKEETKQREGDPHVKARVRSLQRDLARRRMMAAVPTADVVVTNPTHLAVALQYERGKMESPMVVAKGRNRIAQRIRELASEHGVPIVEDKQLARSLFESVEIDQAVPVNLYKAVAEVLAYVYRLKNKTLV